MSAGMICTGLLILRLALITSGCSSTASPSLVVRGNYKPNGPYKVIGVLAAETPLPRSLCNSLGAAALTDAADKEHEMCLELLPSRTCALLRVTGPQEQPHMYGKMLQLASSLCHGLVLHLPGPKVGSAAGPGYALLRALLRALMGVARSLDGRDRMLELVIPTQESLTDTNRQKREAAIWAEMHKIWEGLEKPELVPDLNKLITVRVLLVGYTAIGGFPKDILQQLTHPALPKPPAQAQAQGGPAAPQEHSAHLPLQLLPSFAAAVWAAVANRRTLDLQHISQQCAGAECEEVAKACERAVAVELSELQTLSAEMETIPDLADTASHMLQHLHDNYSSQLHDLQGFVAYGFVRSTLRRAVKGKLQLVYEAQVQMLLDRSYTDFCCQFAELNDKAKDFQESCTALCASICDGFQDQISQLVPPELKEEWSYKTQQLHLSAKMQQQVEQRLQVAEMHSAAVKPPPWWKQLLMQSIALGFQYLQAKQSMRPAKESREKKDKMYPAAPTF